MAWCGDGWGGCGMQAAAPWARCAVGSGGRSIRHTYTQPDSAHVCHPVVVPLDLWPKPASLPGSPHCLQGREAIAAKLSANIITEAGADRVLAMDLHSGQCVGYFDIPVDHVYGDSGAAGWCVGVGWGRGRSPGPLVRLDQGLPIGAPGCWQWKRSGSMGGAADCRGMMRGRQPSEHPSHPVSVFGTPLFASRLHLPHPTPMPRSHPGLPLLQAHLQRRPGGGVP